MKPTISSEFREGRGDGPNKDQSHLSSEKGAITILDHRAPQHGGVVANWKTQVSAPALMIFLALLLTFATFVLRLYFSDLISAFPLPSSRKKTKDLRSGTHKYDRNMP